MEQRCYVSSTACVTGGHQPQQKKATWVVTSASAWTHVEQDSPEQ